MDTLANYKLLCLFIGHLLNKGRNLTIGLRAQEERESVLSETEAVTGVCGRKESFYMRVNIRMIVKGIRHAMLILTYLLL